MNLCFYMLTLLLFLFCGGCSSSSDDADTDRSRFYNHKGEYIYRKQNEFLFTIPPPEKVLAKGYPWDKGRTGHYAKITKDYFRCKGSQLNPCRIVQGKQELARYHDCGGADKHSLPLREGKEFIYPVLIELVNYIQSKTGKRVVITSGHRCPEHNVYADPGPENQYSKHMIGAEVDFYVQGMEEKPEAIVQCIRNFYVDGSKYKGQKDYEEFKRYEKTDANVSTPPWFNKEVFVKLYKKKEGRNFDNRHPYPYISIQVRYDRDLNEKVIYSWDKAYRNYHRW